MKSPFTSFCLLVALLTSIGVNAQTYSFALDNEPYANLDQATVVSTDFTSGPYIINCGHATGAFNVVTGDTLLIGDSPFVLGGNSDVADMAFALDPLVGYPIEPYDTTSSISWQVDGQPGQKTLKVQWKNFGLVDYPGLYFNIQLWLEQSTQHVIFHYGPSNAPANVFASATGQTQTGIFRLSFDFTQVHEFLVLSSNPAEPVASSTSFQNLSGFPSSGTRYIFNNLSSPAVAVPEIDETSDNKPLLTSYPNPASHQVTFALNPSAGASIYEITITDITGKQVVRTTLSGGERYFLDPSSHGIKAGMYMVHLRNEHGLSETSQLLIN